MIAAAILFALPLLVVSPQLLRQQYHGWYLVGLADTVDRGDSVMGLLARVVPGHWPNWPVQLAGTLVLLAPLVQRRDRWTDPDFRRRFLCSVLLFVLLFNHQAERPSFIVAIAGVAIWYATSPATVWRSVLALSTLLSLRALPCLGVWLVIQYELWSWPRAALRAPMSATDALAAQATG